MNEKRAKSSQCHHRQTGESREAELPTSSTAEQMTTDADGGDCRGLKPGRSSEPASDLQPDTDGQLFS